MLKISRLFRNVLLVASLAALNSCTPAPANEWKAAVIPASLNPDNTIRLAGGEVQEIAFILQADKEVTARAASHNLTLEWDMPSGMSIVGSGGCYPFAGGNTQLQEGRALTSVQTQVTNGNILGVPGSRPASESKNESLFVSVPADVPAAQSYIQLKLTDGDYTQTFRWPLQVITLTPPAVRPKHTPLGLWDYSYSRAVSDAAAVGVAKFFKDSGISFTQSAGNATYRKALQAQGITTGGYTWEGDFSDPGHVDNNPAGKPMTGGFPDPQAIISLPEGAQIAGVRDMVTAAKSGDGIATLDFEPHGAMGFGPASVQAFKLQYHVSDADFETFQKYVAANGLKTFQSTDPLISTLWGQWTQFRTAQSSGYVRRLSQAFKAQFPGGRFAVTPSNKYGAGSTGTLAFGCDNAAMAQYTDIIMPQIYNGYGGAEAKLAMQTTAGWRQEIQQEKAKTQLWPLLLVRYAGAGFGNSSQHLRQQVIGCLAHGANGILFYYPGVMDAPYWEMIARATEDIAKYEDFYQDGTRVDGQFPLSGMPQGSAQVNMYPNYQETVKNPGWAFTAHQLGNKVLLTMINLQDANEQIFTVNTGNAKVLSSQNVEKKNGGQWLVKPGQIGFIILDRS